MLCQGLSIIISHSTGGEALPNRAGQVVEARERARAVNRGGHLVAKGHGSPFGLLRPVAGVVTQVGKAPPSPEMTISGLTESGLSGRIMSPNNDLPRLCRTCGPPLRRAVSFLGSTSPVSRKSLCAIGHSAPWR